MVAAVLLALHMCGAGTPSTAVVAVVAWRASVADGCAVCENAVSSTVEVVMIVLQSSRDSAVRKGVFGGRGGVAPQ